MLFYWVVVFYCDVYVGSVLFGYFFLLDLVGVVVVVLDVVVYGLGRLVLGCNSCVRWLMFEMMVGFG